MYLYKFGTLALLFKFLLTNDPNHWNLTSSVTQTIFISFSRVQTQTILKHLKDSVTSGTSKKKVDRKQQNPRYYLRNPFFFKVQF